MRPSLAVASWLAKKLHPPLTLTPRESQQLLLTLQSSFRHQLERGPSHSSKDVGKTSIVESDAPSKSKYWEDPSSAGLSPAFKVSHEADQHLQSILRHPLFTVGEPSRLPPRGRRVNRPPTTEESFREYVRRAENPVEYFREEVARGTITIARAAGFLKRQYNRCMEKSTGQTRAESLKASGTVDEVLRWMAGARLDAMTVLLDGPFVSRFMPFLLAEGRTNILASYMVASGDRISNRSECLQRLYRHQAGILNALVEAESRSDDRDAPFQQFLRAYRAWGGERRVRRKSGRVVNPLVRPGTYLVEVCMVKRQWPSMEVLDEFLATRPGWAQSTAPAMWEELLQERPDAMPSYEALAKLKDGPAGSISAHRIRAWLEMASRLLERGEHADGSRLLLGLEELWPKVTGGGLSPVDRGEIFSPTYGLVERLFGKNGFGDGEDDMALAGGFASERGVTRRTA